MFILVADEVYNHFCSLSLIFWWPLKLLSTWDHTLKKNVDVFIRR